MNFVQNPYSTNKSWLQDEKRNLRYAFEEIRYGFAEDNYILPMSWNYADSTLWMHIQDPAGKYEGKRIALTKENYFDLHEKCGLMDRIISKEGIS